MPGAVLGSYDANFKGDIIAFTEGYMKNGKRTVLTKKIKQLKPNLTAIRASTFSIQ